MIFLLSRHLPLSYRLLLQTLFFFPVCVSPLNNALQSSLGACLYVGMGY